MGAYFYDAVCEHMPVMLIKSIPVAVAHPHFVADKI